MKKQILIVDDSSTTRKLISLYLKIAGYNVISAINGIDALEKLAKTQVDLVITDLNMPQMDGLELIKSIREDKINLGDIPVILLTTEEEIKSKAEATIIGATVYLCKPVSQDKLSAEVKKLLCQT